MGELVKRKLSREVRRVLSSGDANEMGEYLNLPRGAKTICIPVDEEEHTRMIEKPAIFRAYLNGLLEKRPELFPQEMPQGYELHDFLPASVKLGIRMRRIKILATGEVFMVRPSFVMPYMTGYTKDVAHPLFLQRFGVPYWALTHVFGGDDMYWYRMVASFGRNSIVGTTVKDPARLPEDIVADEKHTTLAGEKAYVATVAGDNCVLGAALCTGAGTPELTEGYGVFAEEAKNVNPDYRPETVNTDGWKATCNAWLCLFPKIVVIICFLHAFINIRDRCKRLGAVFNEIGDKVWDVYRAETKQAFAQRIRRLKEWADKTFDDGIVRDKILALCNKSRLFQKAYDHRGAHRTSNMIDRLMKDQDRYLFFMQYFHGHFFSAEMGIRTWAILHNFQPYCSRVVDGHAELECAAVRLNGFRYRDNWLENLLVSASMGGYRQ